MLSKLFHQVIPPSLLWSTIVAFYRTYTYVQTHVLMYLQYDQFLYECIDNCVCTCMYVPYKATKENHKRLCDSTYVAFYERLYVLKLWDKRQKTNLMNDWRPFRFLINSSPVMMLQTPTFMNAPRKWKVFKIFIIFCG